MGNLCGKPSSKDNFEGPGRVLGAAPPPQSNAKASIPSRITNAKTESSAKKPKVGGPPRTVGGGASENTGSDPRSAAAAAAEARAKKTPTGDLAKKLEVQKKQTQSQTLQSVAAENLARREADAATETRNYN